jgi:hypothetical protein
MRYWGLEPTYDAGRLIPIYEALKTRVGDEFSLVDVACGVGIIADGLKWMYPKADITQFDVMEYPEWAHLNVKPSVMDVKEFIQTDKKYDVVLFLNSYRNEKEGFSEIKADFDAWVKKHARYFITSGLFPAHDATIGSDVKGHSLKLYTL